MQHLNRITTNAFTALTLAATVLAFTSPAEATHYRGGLMTWISVSKAGPPTSYPTVQTEMLSMQLSGGPVSQILPVPNVGEQFIVDSFFDVTTEISIDGQTFNVDSFFDIEYLIIPSSTGQTGSWETEMISMSLSGDVPGVGPYLIRNDPNLPSPGQLTATDLPDGTFQIDSFFDVFTEISIAGGPFEPAVEPMRVELRGTALPEPASLALLGLGALGLVRRRVE